MKCLTPNIMPRRTCDAHRWDGGGECPWCEIAAQKRRTEFEVRSCLGAVAAVLNNQLRDSRWRTCTAINRELQVRGIPFMLIDRGGDVDADTLDAIAAGEEKP